MKNKLTDEIIGLIDWREFFRFWKIREKFPEILQNAEAKKLYDDANNLLKKLQKENFYCGEAKIEEFRAESENDNIIINEKYIIRCLRQQTKKHDGSPYYCLADFIAEKNGTIGIFAITTGAELEKKSQYLAKNGDMYDSLLYLSIAERLVEAFSQFYQKKYFEERREKTGEDCKIIAAAIGYPSLPDLRIMKIADKILDLKSIGITLSDSCMMLPVSSVCGFYIIHPKARYFAVGKISDEQYLDYAERGNESMDEVKKWVK